MLRSAITVLHVSSVEDDERFYCGPLGFRREFAYRPDPDRADPCYLGLAKDEVRLHVSSFSGDGVAGGVVFLLVDDIDSFFRELADRGVDIDLPPTDQTWGNREMYLSDPDGNSLRFVESAPARAAS